MRVTKAKREKEKKSEFNWSVFLSRFAVSPILLSSFPSNELGRSIVKANLTDASPCQILHFTSFFPSLPFPFSGILLTLVPFLPLVFPQSPFPPITSLVSPSLSFPLRSPFSPVLSLSLSPNLASIEGASVQSRRSSLLGRDSFVSLPESAAWRNRTRRKRFLGIRRCVSSREAARALSVLHFYVSDVCVCFFSSSVGFQTL